MMSTSLQAGVTTKLNPVCVWGGGGGVGGYMVDALGWVWSISRVNLRRDIIKHLAVFPWFIINP